MNQELGFETMPFEIAPEFPGELFEEESEWGRRGSFAGGGSRYSRPGSRPSPRPGGAKRPPTPRPRPILRGPRGLRAVIREPYGIVSEPYPGEPEPSSSERVRWIQDCLNQASGLRLPVTGVMGPETRSAVRSFQKQQGLRANGIVGPDTERALQALCRNDKVVSITEDEQLRGLLASEDDLAAEEEIVINGDTTVMIEPIGTYPLNLEESWRNLDKDKSFVYVIYDITTTASPKAIYVGESKDPKTRFSGRLKVLKDLGIDLSTLRSRVARTYKVSLNKEPLPDAIQFRDKGSTTTKLKDRDWMLRQIAQTVFYSKLKPSAGSSAVLQDICISKGPLQVRLKRKTGESQIVKLEGGEHLTAKVGLKHLLCVPRKRPPEKK